jgi:DNA repair protein RecO (recombination protein O)
VRPDRSEAIILQSFPSRERDKLVVFLTPEKGKRKGWAYGARGMRSRFGASLEPLAKVELVFLEKESEDTVRIESASMIRSAFPAQQELARSLAATYIAESVDTFVQADDPSELVYRLLDRIVEALLAGRPVEPVVAYAEIWILKLGGVFPSIRHCAICQKPLERPLRCDIRGGLVCSDCAEPGVMMIANPVADLLGTLISTPVADFASMAIAPDDLFELRALARDLRRYVLGHELKSHDLLQSVIRA